MRYFLLAALFVALVSPAEAQSFRRELSRRGGYQPQYVSIPRKPKEEPKPLPAPVEVDREEVQLQRTLARMRRAPIAGNVRVTSDAVLNARELERQRRADLAQERHEQWEAEQRAYDAQRAQQAKLDAIYDAARARAAAEADARWETSKREILLDALLRHEVPQRQQVEVYHYEPYVPQPGEIYFDGVVFRRAR